MAACSDSNTTKRISMNRFVTDTKETFGASMASTVTGGRAGHRHSTYPFVFCMELTPASRAAAAIVHRMAAHTRVIYSKLN